MFVVVVTALWSCVSSHLSPVSIKNYAASKSLNSASLVAAAILGPYLALKNNALASESGQLEYMPALQGLDYGKVCIFRILSFICGV